MVLVHVNESEPIWFGRKMDAVGARFTVYMGEDRIIAYPDEYVASRERHPMQFLAGLIRDRAWVGRILASRWTTITTRPVDIRS